VTPADPHLPLIVSFPPTELARTHAGRKFLAMTKQYLVWLRDRRVHFLVSLHDSRDLEFAPAWMPEGVEVFFSDDVERIVERYEACRGVIGFRLHAALLGLGLGKPIVPVGVDWRGLGFIETFGLEEFAVRARRRGQFPRLIQSTELLLNGDDALVGLLAERKQDFHRRYHAFLSGAAARHGSLRRAA
jgi:polysaccharide pyruvyl transferase WcaK-like protein